MDQSVRKVVERWGKFFSIFMALVAVLSAFGWCAYNIRFGIIPYKWFTWTVLVVLSLLAGICTWRIGIHITKFAIEWHDIIRERINNILPSPDEIANDLEKKVRERLEYCMVSQMLINKVGSELSSICFWGTIILVPLIAVTKTPMDILANGFLLSIGIKVGFDGLSQIAITSIEWIDKKRFKASWQDIAVAENNVLQGHIFMEEGGPSYA